MMRFFLLMALAVCCAAATAQDIRVRLLDGKTGRPIANTRLLIFGTNSSTDPHEFSFARGTDDHGEAILPADQLHGRFLQVFTDFMTDCVSNPNRSALSVEAIHAKGLVRENTCSKLSATAHPHELVVFARKPTLREKMAW